MPTPSKVAPIGPDPNPRPKVKANPKPTTNDTLLKFVTKLALAALLIFTVAIVCSLGFSGHLSGTVVGWTCFGCAGLYLGVGLVSDVPQKNWGSFSVKVIISSVLLPLSALCATGILSITVFSCITFAAAGLMCFPCCCISSGCFIGCCILSSKDPDDDSSAPPEKSSCQSFLPEYSSIDPQRLRAEDETSEDSKTPTAVGAPATAPGLPPKHDDID